MFLRTPLRTWLVAAAMGTATLSYQVSAHAQQSTGAEKQQTTGAAKQLSDEDITAAVESEFFTDAAVPHNDIDVKTANGIVTLSGNVSSLLGRDYAQRLAQTVRGVRSVVNRISVTPRTKTSDEELKKELEAGLAYDPATDSYDLEVAVKNQVAFLTGEVDSFAERDLAERVARSVSGVRDVRNAVIVEYRQRRSDAEISADVRARLRWDAYLAEELIDVGVRDGRVVLSGKVGSDAERTRAYLDAWVTGTRAVETKQLTVEPWLNTQQRKPTPTVSDTEIEGAIQAALLYDPRVSSFKVTPRVRDGVATLRGTVADVKAKRAAVKDARGTTGVARVIDRIRVRSEPADDAEAARSIREAFGRDPYVERFELLVSVNDGIARLEGTVDSYFEKVRAEQIASAAKGVESVRNTLTVYDDRSPLVYEPRVYDFYPYDYVWYSFAPTTYRTDAEIRSEIRDELFWSPFVDSDAVKVRVEDGVATLEGKVDTYAEVMSALENAYEGGATAVRNRLEVD